MTDKQIIETLKNIHKYCLKTECPNCVFNYSIGEDYSLCQIEKLVARLYGIPRNWNIEIIEEILSE